MKKISRIQASKRILQIAKAVAQVEASNQKLTPLEIAKVQKTVAVILASANIDSETLDQIQALDNETDNNNVNHDGGINNKNQQKGNLLNILRNEVIRDPQVKQGLNKFKERPLSSAKKFLKQEYGIVLTRNIKLREFALILAKLVKYLEEKQRDFDQEQDLQDQQFKTK